MFATSAHIVRRVLPRIADRCRILQHAPGAAGRVMNTHPGDILVA